MDKPEKSEKRFNANPLEATGTLSKLTFWWLRKVFITGCKRDLDASDMFECLDAHKSDNVYSHFKKLWKEERTRQNANLLRVFWQAYGTSVTTICLLYSVVDTVCRCATPWFLAQLLTFFSKTPTTTITQSQAHLYGIGVIMCTLIPGLMLNWYNLWSSQLALKMRIGCCCLMFEKILHATRSDGMSAGRAINLMTNDTSRFEQALIRVVNLFKGPLQTFVVTYFVYVELGFAGLTGLGFMLSTVPIQCNEKNVISQFVRFVLLRLFLLS